jgi:ABC-2 type transport system permease protein
MSSEQSPSALAAAPARKSGGGAKQPLRTGLRVLEVALFLGAAIMINVSSATGLFQRLDLTESGLYSLSAPSIDAVSSLREPLTIRAFFTPNLPAPYNTVEQAVRDLLDEYAAHGGDLFNFQFVSMGAAEVGQEEAIANEELARQYLIYPIQIEQLDRDEVTLSTAYTGMALIHGDLIETIPSITDTSQLELTITEAITKLTERVSRLIALDEDIQVQLFFSSRLTALAPGVDQVPGEIEALVKELNASYFDRLRFEHIDATEDTVPIDEGRRLRLAPLQLQAPDGSAELAYAGLSVTSEGTTITMNLLQGSVMGYQLADMETIRRSLDDTLKNILGTQEEMGYLADFETPPYRGRANATTQTDMVEAELSNLFQLVSSEYTYRGLLLEDRLVPEGLRSMLVVGPQEPLNEWALFQIDQFLLRGGSLMLFLDSHSIYVSQGGGFGGGGAFHLPRETGLEAMLEHYGIRLKQSYVLDEQAFVQRQPSPRGGYSESEIYFAPLLKEDEIDQELPFLTNLEELIMLNISPLELVSENLQAGVTYTEALRTSPSAWEMAERIDLMGAQPPGEDLRASFPLAILAQGTFTSYFAEREIPERPRAEPSSQDDDEEAQPIISAEELQAEQSFTPEGEGRLFVVGTSAILGSGFIDVQGRNPNSLLLLNLIDAMNGREDRALMRTKGRRVRPLREIEPPRRTAVKTFAVAGLPALLVLAGVVVWVLGGMRRHRIRLQYGSAAAPSESSAAAVDGGRGAGGISARGGAKGGAGKGGSAAGGGASC